MTWHSAHTVYPSWQEMCNTFSALCNLFGLKISTKKKVVLAANDPPPYIQISGESLPIVDQFCNLGSTIANTATLINTV